MIPISLKLSGFLSYRDPVEIDFTGFDLACISGANGAGKSSLLDAVTWALFGQARKRDESLVNLQSKAAEVVFTFAYENNIYRVIRALPRGKTTSLEFQIQHSAIGNQQSEWRPLTERTIRDTQSRIESILRLDYETFVNASFFLQGKADQFTQQPPGKRKAILSNILGLEIWEIYRERAAERRKVIERELSLADDHIQEIEAELTEEPQRNARLAELEELSRQLAAARKAQESALANIKQVRAALDKQRELVEKLAEVLKHSQANLSGLQTRLDEKEVERASYADLQARAGEIESAYAAWQSARAELERWEAVAEKFREQEKKRQPLLEEIASERARLEQEQKTLLEQERVTSDQLSVTSGLETELSAGRNALEKVETKLIQRAEVEAQEQAAREKQAELRAENERMKSEMDELKARIDKLEAADGAICPLCGQPLSPDERAALIERLTAEGKEMGGRWRANRATIDQIATQIADLESQILNLASAENERLAHSNAVAQITERLETLHKQAADWETVGARRLKEITRWLEAEKFAAEARKKLAKVDQELADLGYDAAAHDAARRAESVGRAAEAEYRALELARAALKPLEDEIHNLQSRITNQQSTIGNQQSEYDAAAAALAAAESRAPDLESAERALFDLQEQENRLNQEVGAARQKVTVLDDLRARKVRLESEREELARQIDLHKTLERAFGKDGVPALLIEQALPEIEAKANELLDRLSDGTMSVRFVTQAAYKDKTREDLKETLDIQISDGAGIRDYEMYSGGEAFRVNFAIRLALSGVLAQRKGARLQTLVIDEGFGSQDAQGRQRLIEAINAVRGDFAKILVITHLDELKDAFPTRIEVEKAERGSTVRVM